MTQLSNFSPAGNTTDCVIHTVALVPGPSALTAGWSGLHCIRQLSSVEQVPQADVPGHQNKALKFKLGLSTVRM